MTVAADVTSRSMVQVGMPRPLARLRSKPVEVPLPALRSDMHPTVYRIAFACWVLLLGEFFLMFLGSGEALFMVGIDAVFAAVFFSIPWLMNRMNRQTSTYGSGLPAFLSERFDTLYGPIGGFDALVQVIIVPLALSVGGIAICFIIPIARAAQ